MHTFTRVLTVYYRYDKNRQSFLVTKTFIMKTIILKEKDLKNLKLTIDNESVNIYIDNYPEPIHVCYWNIEEVEEDANVMISIANAIDLFHTNPKELLERLGLFNKPFPVV